MILADESDGPMVANLREAVRAALADAFANSGQTCTACSAGAQ